MQQADEFGISGTPLFPSAANTQPQDGASDSAAGQESQESVTCTDACRDLFCDPLRFIHALIGTCILVGTHLHVVHTCRFISPVWNCGGVYGLSFYNMYFLLHVHVHVHVHVM